MKEAQIEHRNSEERILEDIKKARSLYAVYGEALERDAGLNALVAAYREGILKTAASMREMGVVGGCTVCATEGAGSCCFQGIEDGYDHMLLLINLLLGCDIPNSREILENCFFVGEKGCKLIARYYFCIHYLCPDLQELLGQSRCKDLLSAVGEELSAGWELEQALHQWFYLN